MVRFRDVLNHRTEELSEWKYGVIVAEYHTWEKVARILYNGKIVSIHASNVQKAGKKDKTLYKNHGVKNIKGP